MGVTISSNKMEFDMGYFSFNNFRTEIATLIDLKLGEMYLEQESTKEVVKYLNSKEDELNINQETLNFLYSSDCDNEIDSEECGKILECIKYLKSDKEWGYQGRKGLLGGSMMKLDDFKNMLEECAKEKVCIRWS